MFQHHTFPFRWRRMSLAVLVALAMLAVSLIALQLRAQAGFIASGAGGCGTFRQAILSAPNVLTDRAIIAQMIPAKTTDGIAISKNLIIQGGWMPPQTGCQQANEPFTDTTDLLARGFTFLAPVTRSILQYDLGPVLNIDPAVVSLTIQHIDVRQLGITTTRGGGISGVITDGAAVLLENLSIGGSRVVSDGGALRMEVRGGSRLVISGGLFLSNTATTGDGGGFEIWVYDTSEVVLRGVQVASNTAAASGGGGHIVMDGGTLSITGSHFANNQAGWGNALAIESVGSRPAVVRLNNNTFDGGTMAGGNGVQISGEPVQLEGNNFHHLFLPLALNNVPFARITGITLNGEVYEVAFEASGFTPQLAAGRQHLHFFFDTVPPSEAGVPGAGPWKIYPTSPGGPADSPYTGYTRSEKPPGATQMCVLIAEYDHSVRQGSGNCFDLP
ncbi:MAG: right-handed parallel beta-helix repeat-containing protein [Caldilineae bacterium]|nr:MAG: right-handed parallel beta-helix repeat-containing protein [Caldilineae bacterium]